VTDDDERPIADVLAFVDTNGYAMPRDCVALVEEVRMLRRCLEAYRAPEAHWECQQRIDSLEQQLAAMADAMSTLTGPKSDG
jgi:hypothetical protein